MRVLILLPLPLTFLSGLVHFVSYITLLFVLKCDVTNVYLLFWNHSQIFVYRWSLKVYIVNSIPIVYLLFTLRSKKVSYCCNSFSLGPVISVPLEWIYIFLASWQMDCFFISQFFIDWLKSGHCFSKVCIWAVTCLFSKRISTEYGECSGSFQSFQEMRSLYSVILLWLGTTQLVLQLSENFSLEGFVWVCYLQVIQGEVCLP